MSVPVRGWWCPGWESIIPFGACGNMPATEHVPLVERDAHRLEVMREVAEALRRSWSDVPSVAWIAAALEKGEMP